MKHCTSLLAAVALVTLCWVMTPTRHTDSQQKKGCVTQPHIPYLASDLGTLLCNQSQAFRFYALTAQECSHATYTPVKCLSHVTLFSMSPSMAAVKNSQNLCSGWQHASSTSSHTGHAKRRGSSVLYTAACGVSCDSRIVTTFRVVPVHLLVESCRSGIHGGDNAADCSHHVGIHRGSQHHATDLIHTLVLCLWHHIAVANRTHGHD